MVSHFSLVVFEIPSLALILESLIIVCLGKGSLRFSNLEFVEVFNLLMYTSHYIWVVFSHYLSNINLSFFSLSLFSSGTYTMCMKSCFLVSHILRSLHFSYISPCYLYWIISVVLYLSSVNLLSTCSD